MFVLARTFVFWSATIPFISKYASLEPKFHEILNKVCLVKMLIEMKSPENCNFLNILVNIVNQYHNRASKPH